MTFHLVLFPQNSLILLLLTDLLIIKLLVHLLGHRGLSLDSNLVLEKMLCVLVSEGEEPGGDESADGEDDSVGSDVNAVNSPVEPHRDGGDDEGVTIEESAGLGGVILAEALQQQLLLTRHLS